MAEINLLPDELREKEARELEAVRKKPKLFKVEMSSPTKEKVTQPLRISQPSLLSRLFAKKLRPASSSPSALDLSTPEKKVETSTRETEKIFHIPKVESFPPDLKSNLLVGTTEEKKEKQSEVERRGVTQEVESTPEEVKITPAPVKVVTDVRSVKKKRKFSFSGWFRIFGRSKKEKKEKEKVEKEMKEMEQRQVEVKIRKSRDKKEGGGKEILDINLIPEELAKHPELELPQKLFKGGLAIFVTILIIGAAYLGISWYKFNILRQKEVIGAEIASINTQISQSEKEKPEALELQSRLKLVKQLLDEHVYWTKFFSLLERYTIEEVYYLGFSMVGRDKLVISAVGKDYNSVAKQLVAFEKAEELVKNVKIDAASAEIDSEKGQYSGVSFNINLEFLPNVFLKPIK